MKLKIANEVEAAIVVTARLAASGEFEARVAASCEYAPQELPGSTASADVPVPAPSAQAIEAAMVAAIKAVEHDLGKRLGRAQAEAYRVSMQQGEFSPGVAPGAARRKVR